MFENIRHVGLRTVPGEATWVLVADGVEYLGWFNSNDGYIYTCINYGNFCGRGGIISSTPPTITRLITGHNHENLHRTL